LRIAACGQPKHSGQVRRSNDSSIELNTKLKRRDIGFESRLRASRGVTWQTQASLRLAIRIVANPAIVSDTATATAAVVGTASADSRRRGSLSCTL
jgi:predicted component of type VI protein secretion system